MEQKKTGLMISGSGSEGDVVAPSMGSRDLLASVKGKGNKLWTNLTETIVGSGSSNVILKTMKIDVMIKTCIFRALAMLTKSELGIVSGNGTHPSPEELPKKLLELMKGSEFYEGTLSSNLSEWGGKSFLELLNEYDSPNGGFDKRFLEIINKWKTVAESEASQQ